MDLDLIKLPTGLKKEKRKLAERKFIYLLTDLDENQEKNACVRTEDGFGVIFTVRLNNNVVEPRRLAQDMIDMIDIFDESAELDKDGYIIGPSFKIWNWS